MVAGGYSLIGDIGGTNARFALVPHNSVMPERIQVLPVQEYDNLDAALHHYCREVNQGLETISAACFAFAGPIHLEQINQINSNCAISKPQLQKRLHMHTLKLINELPDLAL